MKKMMIEAFEFKRKGYYKQAIELLYKALAKESENLEIISELGELYYLLKNFDRAKHYIKKALEIDEEHIHSLKLLRQIYSDENDVINAGKIANKIYVLTNTQDDLEIFLNFLNKQGKYYQATGFKDFIQSNKVAYQVGYAFYKVQKLDDAREVLENLLDKDCQSLLCKIYFETKQFDNAKIILEKLDNMDTNDKDVLNYMGLEKLDNFDLDNALTYFKKALEQDPQNDTYNFNIGQAYFLKGWLEEAKKYFLTAICLNPENPNYRYSLGYTLYRMGDYNNALVQLDNDLLESKVLAMLIKYQQGDLVTAKSNLEKLLQENPENDNVLYALAKIYLDLDMNNKSVEMIKKAIEVDEKNYDYKAFLCDALVKSNRLDEAKEVIEDLLSKHPHFYQVQILYAQYLNAIKDFDNLFETAQKMIEMDLNRYEGYYYNALSLFAKQDVNFAIESLKKAIMLDVENANLYVKMCEFYQAIGQNENAFEYIKEASDIDKSEKNKELYTQLANILRKNRNTAS